MIRGRQVVNLFGEAVQSTITTGDHYRKRHDVYKMRLFQMCQWAGLEAEVEVFNLFAGSIPQEGSRTRYTPCRQGQEATRAVDKRASELNGEYIKKARTTDQLYCGTAPGTTGPVETKLARLGNVKGIVVGAFGEGSEDLHSLIHHLAFSRVREAGPQKARSGQLRTMEAELALTTSLLRRALSVVGVKAQARLLLGRLETIGPGATAAAGRRNYALNLERIWANERRADLLSRAQGKALLRRGQFRRD